MFSIDAVLRQFLAASDWRNKVYNIFGWYYIATRLKASTMMVRRAETVIISTLFT